MAKIITLSRTFPAYHPKRGQPTYFVEKVWKSLWDMHKGSDNPFYGYFQQYDEAFPLNFHREENIHTHQPKHHTIRAGKRWKDGDMASLRVWSGKPYNSPQIAIAPDVKLTVFDVEINRLWEIWIGGRKIDAVQIEYLAQNDGLSYMDMVGWFAKSLPFSGQILCWSTASLVY